MTCDETEVYGHAGPWSDGSKDWQQELTTPLIVVDHQPEGEHDANDDRDGGQRHGAVEECHEENDARDTNNGHENNEDDASSTSSSSSSSSLSTSNSTRDMICSLTSNLLFLMGGGIQTYTAVWDLWDADRESDDDEDNSAGTEGLFYHFLVCLGPFLFIVNSVVDMVQAWTDNHYSTSCWSRQQFRCCFKEDSVVEEEEEEEASGNNVLILVDNNEETIGILNVDNLQSHHDNNHHSHRNYFSAWPRQLFMTRGCSGISMDFCIAAFFGIGAVLEFFTTLVPTELDDDDDDTPITRQQLSYVIHTNPIYDKLNLVSMHVYLLSGLLASYKERRLFASTWCSSSTSRRRNNIRVCSGLGTMLFLLGSLLDCAISYLYDPELLREAAAVASTTTGHSSGLASHLTARIGGNGNPWKGVDDLTLARCDLVSTLLWFVDAILYLGVDWLMYDLGSKCQGLLRRVRVAILTILASARATVDLNATFFTNWVRNMFR